MSEMIGKHGTDDGLFQQVRIHGILFVILDHRSTRVGFSRSATRKGLLVGLEVWHVP
jgi:hypothetical protein